jgi:cytochrome c5
MERTLMMNPRLIIFFAVLGATLATGAFLSAAQNASQGTIQASINHNKPSRTTHADSSQEGDRVFAEHCARCHNAPEGFSPRIAGTITRHMRVRANLSPEEERAILRFFNP